MDQRERAEELRYRVDASVRAHGGALPLEVAAAWHGYLAAALEWGLVSVAQHEALSALLPDVPATEIFLGHEEPGEGAE